MKTGPGYRYMVFGNDLGILLSVGLRTQRGEVILWDTTLERSRGRLLVDFGVPVGVDLVDLLYFDDLSLYH